MRLSITRRQRSLLFFLSASGYVASFSGVGSRIDAQDVVGPRVDSIVVASRPLPPSVASRIRRDPFDGAPAAMVPDGGPAPHGAPAPAADRDDRNDVVPNIAGAPPELVANATIATSTLVVRATIVGKRSVAYVANGSEMEIVRVGDSLGDRRVASIDLDGIAFTDGSRLDLATTFAATPTPVAKHGDTIVLRIDQLRRLFARSSATVARPPSPTPPPTQMPAPPLTPAPLQTADTTGLMPGTNPTPDLSGPTAFPYPYPYPAARR